MQGAAFVALCFLTNIASAQAPVRCTSNVEAAQQVCVQFSAPDNIHLCGIVGPIGIGSGHACGIPAGIPAFNTVISTTTYIWNATNGLWPPGVFGESNRDSDGCFTSYGLYVCRGDDLWVDEDGYDEDGCINTICIGDSGWYDPDGYNEDGFDVNGLDRGGNTAAQGGGYFGSAGTGGMPPSYIDPPELLNPQTGNNRTSDGDLFCSLAYPVTVTKLLLPPSVQDGLNACANECSYQPNGTFYDFEFNQEVVQLVPTGQPCTTEPDLTSLFITTYTEPPPSDPVPDLMDNLNSCYLNGAFFWCDSVTDPDPPQCFINVNGWLGAEVDCNPPSDQVCGVLNGIYQCLDQTNNCESFSGVIVCADPSGVVIDLTSPDHPINGGNGDGNPNNDVFQDSDDVINNGQPTQDRIIQTLDARQLAREIDNELSDDFDSLELAINNISLGGGGIDAGEILGEGGPVQGQLDGLISSIGAVGTDGDLSYDQGLLTPITDTVGGMLPATGQCAVITYELLPEKGLVIPVNTCDLAPVQPLLEFFLYIGTLLTLYNLAFGTKQENV